MNIPDKKLLSTRLMLSFLLYGIFRLPLLSLSYSALSLWKRDSFFLMCVIRALVIKHWRLNLLRMKKPDEKHRTADYHREYYIKFVMWGVRGRDSFSIYVFNIIYTIYVIYTTPLSRIEKSWCEIYASLCFSRKKTRNNMSNGFDASSYVVKADRESCILTIRFRQNRF